MIIGPRQPNVIERSSRRPKGPLAAVLVRESPTDADEKARDYREAGYSARVWPRELRADGITIGVWLVVVRKRKPRAVRGACEHCGDPASRCGCPRLP